MSEPNPKMTPLAGALFMVAGVAFIAAALLSRNIAFTGVGTAMIAIGVVFIAQSKKGGPK